MNIKKKPLLLSVLFTAMMLASCGGGQSSSAVQSSSFSEASTGTVSSESSSESSGTSEAESSSEEESSSTPTYDTIGDENWVYYAEVLHCLLTLDYGVRDFCTDGIAHVTLNNAIDGDTAHFNDGNDKIIKSRFYGIDTPESTGQVQPYGKQASKFTSEVLNKANKNGTIVVSSAQTTYGVPHSDSTGSRYVSLIWVNTEKKNAPYDELTLLNLEIVQYGYSWVKSVGDMPDYAPIFYAAENQAKNYKLKLFSGEPDPFFNYGDYEDVSLLDIKEEVVACIKDSGRTNKYDNAKVRVQGTVAGFANNIIYIEDFCFYYRQKTNAAGEPLYYQDGVEVTEAEAGDVSNLEPVIEYYNKKTGEPNPDKVMIVGETGEYAGLNIFAGMGTIPSKFTTMGNFIQVCGLALDSQFGFQVTDGSFKTLAYDDNDAQVLLFAKDNTEEHALKTFNYTASELSAVCKGNNYESLNCRVEVSDSITITDYFDADSGAVYLYTDIGVSIYFKFTYKPYPNNKAISWTTGERFVNHKFIFSGVLAIHETQTGKKLLYLYPSNSADMVWEDVVEPS